MFQKIAARKIIGIFIIIYVLIILFTMTVN